MIASLLVAVHFTASAPPAALPGTEASTLRAHVRFLASDSLEGRGTPSRGLNLAAEYIATQFERAGLEPGVNGDFFQWTESPPNRDGFTGKVANVIGILRGSDPELAKTAIIVSAHYDHMGITTREQDDKIYNGANDDASGVACMMGLAEALSKGPRPKRSILFIGLYGEERGLLGSRYYTQNPTWPLRDIIGNLNLEHMGRTDDSEGPQKGSVAITGFDFSDLPAAFVKAGEVAGIKFWKHPKNSDSFFARSDNAAFAMAGIPAHTMSVAYIFPDYHQPGDHWEKLDYANMSAVLQPVAMGLRALADASSVPTWDQANPKVQRYRDAHEKRMSGG